MKWGLPNLATTQQAGRERTVLFEGAIAQGFPKLVGNAVPMK